MIKGIEFENVRIFEGTGWCFPLAPLTVFCGTNSSGKSTLLKVLLLVRQSMGIRESYMKEDGKLRFVGSLVDLGNYFSFVSNNDRQREISVTLTTEGVIAITAANRLRMLKGFSAESTPDDVEFIQYSLKSHFRFSIIADTKTTSDSPYLVSEEDLRGTVFPSPRGFLKSSLFELSVSGEELLTWRVVFSGLDEDGDPEFHMLIPQDYFDSIERLSKIEVDRESEKGCAKVGVFLNGLLPNLLIAQLLPEDGDPVEAQGQWVVGPLPSEIFVVSQDLREALTKVDYIGPLRSPAKRYYITQPDVSPPLDPTGEFLPYILKNIGKYEAWNVPPGLQAEPRSESLRNALNSWIYYLRTGEKLADEIRPAEIDWDTTRVLVEIRVKSVLGDELHALADSGFGYSQLLPIVIRGLLAERGSTLIIEQPELHLNPAIQVRMAEFLVSMARAGKQILIETHSEHIVNTIRVLTAEDETSALAPMCEIFYIDVESGQPVVYKLSIGQDGTVPDWPRQFFGEAASLTGRLLRAQKRFRKHVIAKE